MIKLNVLEEMVNWTESNEFESILEEEKYLFVLGLEYHINKKMADKRLSIKNYGKLFDLHSKVHKKTFIFSVKGISCDMANRFSAYDFYLKRKAA